MTSFTILNVVGVTTATVIFFTGLALLFKFLLPVQVPDNVRMFVGSAMVIYGIFRGTMVVVKQKNARREEEARNEE
ncbi:MAG TPA: hypothetical protein VKS81_09955 [Bacteroidota bacterium]|nr:hypothetical protein [Bacteroidota bacterium]